MRPAKEILARAIIVDTTAQRSHLEEEGGYGCATVEEQEAIRQNMCFLLEENEYDAYMTDEEKSFMHTPVRKASWKQVCEFSFQVECVRPLLWALGLVDDLLGYDGLDMEYYDDILMIGAMEHEPEKILSKCRLRTERDIFKQCEIAMMWHWRAVETRRKTTWTHNIEDILVRIFGENYRPFIQEMPKTAGEYADFSVRGKPVGLLRGQERDMFEMMTSWRQHAFEWLLREDEEWNEISADT